MSGTFRRSLPRLLAVQSISVGRAVSGLLFASIALLPELSSSAIAIYCCGVLSDFVDGYLARRWRCVTHIGSALDVFGDKSLTISSLLYIAARGFDLIPCLLFTVRELFLLSLRSVYLHGKPVLPLSGLLGGITLMPIRLITLFFLLHPGPDLYERSIASIILWLGSGVSLASLLYSVFVHRLNIIAAFRSE